MVKILFGNCLEGHKPVINSSTKVLDVSCGFWDILMPFLVAGCDCYGVEISEEMAKLAEPEKIS